MCSGIKALKHKGVVSTQWRNKGGGKEGHLPPGAAFWGRQIEVGMLRVKITKCQMSTDAINYDSRKCRMPATATQLRNLIKIAVIPKANIYEP